MIKDRIKGDWIMFTRANGDVFCYADIGEYGYAIGKRGNNWYIQIDNDPEIRGTLTEVKRACERHAYQNSNK